MSKYLPYSNDLKRQISVIRTPKIERGVLFCMAKRILKIIDKQERNVTWEDALKDFLLYKKAEGKSERTIYLKTFFNWCVKENILTENPLNGFNRRKATERIVQLDIELLK